MDDALKQAEDLLIARLSGITITDIAQTQTR